MDIEALRKINELTKALQQHGISISSEDAWRQAETIIQPQQDSQKITTTTAVQEHHDGDALLERKYKLMLEMNNKKFETMMATMQDNLNLLTQEIIRLKTEFSNAPNKNTAELTPVKQEQQTQQPVQQTEPKKEAHPRQGQFAPGDISIEKMFYYGHK